MHILDFLIVYSSLSLPSYYGYYDIFIEVKMTDIIIYFGPHIFQFVRIQNIFHLQTDRYLPTDNKITWPFERQIM